VKYNFFKTMNYKKLIVSLALPQIAGLIGSLFTVSAIASWYVTLQKPSFSPPNWLFGPVWVLLYFLMGVSFYLVWQKTQENKKAKTAVWLFLIQLFFNATWSIIFFGLHSPALAFINIIILWGLIVVLIVKFFTISKLAAYLLLPYLAWVSFASLLNFFIWYLN